MVAPMLIPAAVAGASALMQYVGKKGRAKYKNPYEAEDRARMLSQQQMLDAAAAGKGPSYATEQAKIGYDQTANQAASFVAGARSPDVALAQRAAANAQAASTQKIAQNAAAERVKEIMIARDQAAANAQAIRGANTSDAAQRYTVSQNNAAITQNNRKMLVDQMGGLAQAYAENKMQGDQAKADVMQAERDQIEREADRQLMRDIYVNKPPAATGSK